MQPIGSATCELTLTFGRDLPTELALNPEIEEQLKRTFHFREVRVEESDEEHSLTCRGGLAGTKEEPSAIVKVEIKGNKTLARLRTTDGELPAAIAWQVLSALLPGDARDTLQDQLVNTEYRTTCKLALGVEPTAFFSPRYLEFLRADLVDAVASMEPTKDVVDLHPQRLDSWLIISARDTDDAERIASAEMYGIELRVESITDYIERVFVTGSHLPLHLHLDLFTKLVDRLTAS